jgi:hypothetical protein
MCSCSCSWSASCSRLSPLWRLCWFHLRPSSSRGRAKRTTLHRLLSPRCPDDGPACRLASTASSGGGPAPLPVRPWPEVKSRRGAPKRLDTEGFACPNSFCPSFGITDAHVHALLRRWQAWPSRAGPDLSRPCLPHHVPCSTRHSLVPFENTLSPDRHGADLALAEGLDPSAAERVAGLSASEHHEPFCLALASTLRPCTSAPSAPSGSRIFTGMNGVPGCATPKRCCGWPLIPCRALLPVLEFGSRTQNRVHLLIHSLRPILAPGCLPLFTSDGLNVSFSALTAHVGKWREERHRGRNMRRWQVEAGLISGQVKKGYQRCKLVRVTPVRRLGTEADLKIA